MGAARLIERLLLELIVPRHALHLCKWCRIRPYI